MVLNVIDFNNNLQKSYRNRYCIYRNLELGHEIHVWNENSKLIKACRQTLSPNIKKTLDTLHFSYTYELYKLFLMLNVGGWFIEADQIIYSQQHIPEKTMPWYFTLNNCNMAAFVTWAPIFIKNDNATNFYLKKSLDTLKMNLENGIYDFAYREIIYQCIYIAPLCEGISHDFIIPSFCQKYDLWPYSHYSTYGLTHDFIRQKDIKNNDIDFVLHCFFIDCGIETGYGEFSFDNLLKFDTFKIML